MNGWEARIIEDAAGFVRHQQRLVLWRPLADGRVEYAIEQPLTLWQGDGIAEGPPAGILLPSGAVEAISAHLFPGATAGETRRLEEALQIERLRVDSFLSALLSRGLASPATPPYEPPF